METIWKVFSCFVALLFLELCNGLPLDLDHSYADGHTQFLTGLIAVLLTICGVICLAGCLCCQRRNGFKEFRDSPVVISVASNLDHGHVNPIANGEFTIFTPLTPPLQNNNVFLANQQVITRAEEDFRNGDIDVTSWFDTNEKDFPRTRLKYIKEFGKGWFGRVVEGTAQGLEDDDTVWTPVIVRILEATASRRQRVLFLHDAAIYRCPPHPNLLRLLGRSLESIPLLLLQEHSTQGDLKLYLRKQQQTKESFLSSELPLRWCHQLASAVKHLHDYNITHRDLAARNCQISQELDLKLGDYGCSTSDYPEDYYHGTENVPVRWCAPECVSYTATTIQTKNVTMASNIWSLGVCLWEIYECGEQPYASLSDDEVVSQVLGPPNVRLLKPSFTVLYTDYVYKLMQLCWLTHELRPSISQIDLMLADLVQVHKNTSVTNEDPPVSIQDFDSRWETLKPNVIVKKDNHILQVIEPENDLTNITVLNMSMKSDQDVKNLSASLHNLAGSFDNLLETTGRCDISWLDNVESDDLSFARGLSDAIHDLDSAIAAENLSSSDSSPRPVQTSKLQFKLGPTSTDMLLQRTSSESETEDELWKKKIERGAYTEKVRIKSRSVADLMVLTHIDCSESDSETPLPSLDCRFNYKNVRYGPKQNLENISLTFGSEGNLLSVQDTFQQELKKLQEERRDSLLFVPDNTKESHILTSCPETKKVLEDLNSTANLEPQNQVFNVYNVVAISPKYSPIHKTDLNQIINYKDDVEKKQVLPDLVLNTIESNRDIPKLSEIIENNIELMDYIVMKYDSSTETNSMEDIDYLKSNYVDDKNEINKAKSGNMMDIINHDKVALIDNKGYDKEENIGLMAIIQPKVDLQNKTDSDILNGVITVDLTDVDIKTTKKNEYEENKLNLVRDKSTHGQCDNEAIETITSTPADKIHLSNTENRSGCVEIPKQNLKSAVVTQHFQNSEVNKYIPEQNKNSVFEAEENDTSDSQTSSDESVDNLDNIIETINSVIFEEVNTGICDERLIHQVVNVNMVNDNILLKEKNKSQEANLPIKEKCTTENKPSVVENKFFTDVEPVEAINPIVLEKISEEIESTLKMVQETPEEIKKSNLQETAINSIEIEEDRCAMEIETTVPIDGLQRYKCNEIKPESEFQQLEPIGRDELEEKNCDPETSSTCNIENSVVSESKTNFNYIADFINQESYAHVSPTIFNKVTKTDVDTATKSNTSELLELKCEEIKNKENIIQSHNVLELNSKYLAPLNDIKLEDKVQSPCVQQTEDIKMNEVQAASEIISINKLITTEIPESKDKSTAHIVDTMVIKDDPQVRSSETYLENSKSSENILTLTVEQESISYEENVQNDKNDRTLSEISNVLEYTDMSLTDVPKSNIESDCKELNDILNVNVEEFDLIINLSESSTNIITDVVESLNHQNNKSAEDINIQSKSVIKNVEDKKIDSLTAKLLESEESISKEKIDSPTDTVVILNLQKADIILESVDILKSNPNTNIEDNKIDSLSTELIKSEEISFVNKFDYPVNDINLNHFQELLFNTDVTNIESKCRNSLQENNTSDSEMNVQQSSASLQDSIDDELSFPSKRKCTENSTILDEASNGATKQDQICVIPNDKNIIHSEMMCENDVEVETISSAESDTLAETKMLPAKSVVNIIPESDNTTVADSLDEQLEENNISISGFNCAQIDSTLNQSKTIETTFEVDNINNTEIYNTNQSIKKLDVNKTLHNIDNSNTVKTNSLLTDKIQCEGNETTTCVDNIIDKTIINNSSLKQLETSRSEYLVPSSAEEGSDHETGDLYQNLAGENECTPLSKPLKCDSSASESVREALLSPKLENINTENTDNEPASSAADSESAHGNVTVLFGSDKSVIVKTHDFLICEILKYDDSNLSGRVKFDLSETQDECAANSLTHNTGITSTPFKSRSIQENTVILGASDDYSIGYYSGLKTTTNDEREMFSSNFVQPPPDKASKANPDLKYSLETWDNFLGRSFDEQREFDGFSSEPQSMLFLDNQVGEQKLNKPEVQEIVEDNLNSTFIVDDLNRTYDITDSDASHDNMVDLSDINLEMEDSTEEKQGYDNPGYWENETSGGWFLHPQTSGEDVSGQMDVSEDDSYVGFSMDDEIMAAIRNELLTKLPQAQRASAEQIDDGDGEYETNDRNEVFVRYNCYNTPLSPIPEESYSELLHSGQSTPHCTINTDIGDADSDWSEPGLDPNSILDDDTHSPRIIESPHKGPLHRHTPSQDSCCSNDTLFNLEDLQYIEKNLEIQEKNTSTETIPINDNIEENSEEPTLEKEDRIEPEVIPTEPESPSMVTTKQSELSVTVTTHDNLVNENETIDSSLPSSTDNTTMKLVTQLDCVTECESTNCQLAENDILIDKIEKQVHVMSNTALTDKIEESVNSPIKDIVECSENVVSSEKEFVLRIQPTINLDISPTYSADFINAEKQNSCREIKTMPMVKKDVEESSSGSETYLTVSDGYVLPNVAPLNSPEDRPWKHIEASLSRCPPELPETEDVSSDNVLPIGYLPQAKCSNSEEGTLSSNSEEEYGNEYENIEEMNLKNSLVSIKTDYVNVDKDVNGDIYDCIDVKPSDVKTEVKEIIKLNPEYVNDIPTYINDSKQVPIYTNEISTYASCDQKSATAQYVNTQPEYENHKEIPIVYENMNYDVYIDLLNDDPEVEYDNIDSRGSVEDVYGPLTDIRFTGPGDSQMMTTSFSDSNDLGDEQDWDSGSDTRSSSSGEFIWKEGEHEASVKALHAAPQDAESQQDDLHQDEEESSSGSEEDCEGPEFVPSAWDKYAAPRKSALRSPEKTVDRQPKKPRGVSFKKQKYHCVYEYPREPDSPVVQSFDIWQDPNSSIDWDVDRDSDPFLPATSDTETISETPSVTPQNHSNRPHRNLYQTSIVPDFIGSSILDDDFYISSSAKPFDMFSAPSSQFFPGRHCDWSELIKNNDNVTPDSGVEDITPGSLSDSSEYVRPSRQILPLKTLAQLVINKGSQSGSNEIGGLRHTRNRLKLDLPPSPSAFTKTFSIEPILDPVVNRQVPTFTTFGKSRFVVQQVDTPTDDNLNMKNVSFEALPYKPMTTHIYRDDPSVEKHRVEIVRGEASLLDSADEDSGIESCTLETKRVSEVPLK